MHRYSDFYGLMQLVAAGTYFRPTMKAFIGGTLDFDPANPFCNLASNDGRRGVAIFLADSSMLAAENTYTRVVNQSVASYAMKGIGNGVRLPDDIVIWQLPNAGGPPRTYPAYKPPTVNDNPKERPAQVNSDTK